MHLNANDIDDRIKKQVNIETNLWGEQFCTDLRPVAGKSAQISGKLFEDAVYYTIVGGGRIVTKKPKFTCHYGLPRQGDFELRMDNRIIHIECKQLGNVESHFDKLSHVFMNLKENCYGSEMWLVYDYNGNVNERGKNHIRALVERCKQLKKEVALKGITFELILIDDIGDFI